MICRSRPLTDGFATPKPVRKSGFNCFAFAFVLIVNNNFRTGFACALFRLIGRAVVYNKNVIQPFAGSTRDVADVFFVLIGRNNRRGLRSNIFCHFERSRRHPVAKS